VKRVYFVGTLTLNQLTVDKATCMMLGGHSLEDALKWGALSANIVSEEPIDVVLHESYDGRDTLWDEYKLQKFIPFNPTDKYTIAHVINNKTGEQTRIMKGAPQVNFPWPKALRPMLHGDCNLLLPTQECSAQ